MVLIKNMEILKMFGKKIYISIRQISNLSEDSYHEIEKLGK